MLFRGIGCGNRYVLPCSMTDRSKVSALATCEVVKGEGERRRWKERVKGEGEWRGLIMERVGLVGWLRSLKIIIIIIIIVIAIVIVIAIIYAPVRWCLWRRWCGSPGGTPPSPRALCRPCRAGCRGWRCRLSPRKPTPNNKAMMMMMKYDRRVRDFGQTDMQSVRQSIIKYSNKPEEKARKTINEIVVVSC